MNQGSVAIIGSRDYDNYLVLFQFVEETLHQWNVTPMRIVSGGATGVDTMARRYANAKGIEMLEFLPQSGNGKNPWHERNAEIIDHSDYVIAFPSVEGKGTQHAIRLAQEANKKLKVFNIC